MIVYYGENDNTTELLAEMYSSVGDRLRKQTVFEQYKTFFVLKPIDPDMILEGSSVCMDACTFGAFQPCIDADDDMLENELYISECGIKFCATKACPDTSRAYAYMTRIENNFSILIISDDFADRFKIEGAMLQMVNLSWIERFRVIAL